MKVDSNVFHTSCYGCCNSFVRPISLTSMYQFSQDPLSSASPLEEAALPTQPEPGKDPDTIWQTALGELEVVISKASFTTWFKNTSVLEMTEAGEVIVAVPNMFTRNWLQTKYHKQITRSLEKAAGQRITKVTYEITKVPEQARQEHQQRAQAKAPVVPRPATPSLQPAYPTAALNARATQTPTGQLSLNKRYTFDTFVVGANNELALAAARAVTKHPGSMYNPLFIYGGVGLGKTHLTQAIGNEIVADDQSKRVVYVTCEQFTDDFIRYIQKAKGRSDASSAFKQKYRTADVLIIDDIQFLSGKERTQEEFFHTFNELHQNNRQIIITSDRPPKAIQHLEDRLVSRFEGGMIADIGMPDFETRKAILQAKCEERNIQIAPEVLDYVAETVRSNIRELEGSIARVLAHAQLHNQNVSIEIAKQVLSSVISANQEQRQVTPDRILDVVSEFYSVDKEDLLAKNRRKEIVWPRQIAMFLMRTESKSSYPSIGQRVGGRDHTTAIHAFEKVSKRIEQDEILRQEIQAVRQKLYIPVA